MKSGRVNGEPLEDWCSKPRRIRILSEQTEATDGHAKCSTPGSSTGVATTDLDPEIKRIKCQEVVCRKQNSRKPVLLLAEGAAK